MRRLLPVTTFGEKAQMTKPGTKKFGTLQNLTTGTGPIKPQINFVLYQKMCFSSEDRSHRNEDVDPISTNNSSITVTNTHDSEINVV